MSSIIVGKSFLRVTEEKNVRYYRFLTKTADGYTIVHEDTLETVADLHACTSCCPRHEVKFDPQCHSWLVHNKYVEAEVSQATRAELFLPSLATPLTDAETKTLASIKPGWAFVNPYFGTSKPLVLIITAVEAGGRILKTTWCGDDCEIRYNHGSWMAWIPKRERGHEQVNKYSDLKTPLHPRPLTAVECAFLRESDAKWDALGTWEVATLTTSNGKTIVLNKTNNGTALGLVRPVYADLCGGVYPRSNVYVRFSKLMNAWVAWEHFADNPAMVGKGPIVPRPAIADIKELPVSEEDKATIVKSMQKDVEMTWFGHRLRLRSPGQPVRWYVPLPTVLSGRDTPCLYPIRRPSGLSD